MDGNAPTSAFSFGKIPRDLQSHRSLNVLSPHPTIPILRLQRYVTQESSPRFLNKRISRSQTTLIDEGISQRRGLVDDAAIFHLPTTGNMKFFVNFFTSGKLVATRHAHLFRGKRRPKRKVPLKAAALPCVVNCVLQCKIGGGREVKGRLPHRLRAVDSKWIGG